MTTEEKIERLKKEIEGLVERKGFIERRIDGVKIAIKEEERICKRNQSQ